MPQKKAVDVAGDEDNCAVDSGGDGNGRAVRMPQKKAVHGTGDEDGEGDEENRAVDSGGDGNGRAVRMPQKKAVDGTGDEDGEGDEADWRMPQKNAANASGLPVVLNFLRAPWSLIYPKAHLPMPFSIALML